MKSIVIGFMNFSVILANPSGYKLGKKDYETYKEKILDPQRLAVREDIFFNYTVPVVLNNFDDYQSSGIVLRFNIAVSNCLPDHLMGKFKKLVSDFPEIFKIIVVDESSPHNWLEILKEDVGEIVDKYILKSESIPVFNFRLDDDDVLSKNYFSMLKKYLNLCFEDFYITFPNGFLGVYENGFERLFKINKPFLAIGLGKISKFSVENKKFITNEPTIMNKSHTRIASNSRTILDSTEPAYIWTMHQFSDTRSVDVNVKQSHYKINNYISENKLEEIELIEIKKYF